MSRQQKTGRRVVVSPSSSNPLAHANYDPRPPYFSKQTSKHLPSLVANTANNLQFFFSNQKPFINNSVMTARYTLLSFFPKQLVYQFSKFANLYFLFIAILQFVPGWSPTGRFTTIVPLAIFVSLSIAREAYDDYYRHNSDSKENGALVLRLVKGPAGTNHFSLKRNSLNRRNSTILGKVVFGWEQVCWKHLVVGDILKVKDKDFIPADLIVLKTENEDGTCYIETANLDGETNPKQRAALPISRDLIKDEAHLIRVNVAINGETPNGNLHSFEGSLEDVVSNNRFPLTLNQLVLRGSTLVNSGYIIGAVIYTGEESKIRMNANEAVRSKLPLMDRITNKIVILMFSMVIILAGIATLFCWIQNLDWLTPPSYLFGETPDFIILFNALIPISLYVTLEMIKLVQIYFMNHDIKMYDSKSDRPAEARTSSLNEDLGQVQYIFSDKTGTLTDNVMIFRKLSVSGFPFSLINDPESSLFSNLDIPLKDYVKDLNSNVKTPQRNDIGILFLKAIALCHSCSLEKIDDGPTTKQTALQKFQSSSPDEVALVSGARDMGCIFNARVAQTVSLNFQNETTNYQILQTIEFSSKRKRMSIVCRFPDNSIHLIMKGADSIILEKLSSAPLPKDKQEVFNLTMDHISRFATDGLRTLLYASKVLTEEEYAAWAARYFDASCSLEGRVEQMEKIAEELERDLGLLGCTAIEDRLQSQVPQTIDKLRRAGIHVWMLTGDKRETAINIGYTCRLIKGSSKVLTIEGASLADIDGNINNAIVSVKEWKKKDGDDDADDSDKNHGVENHVVLVVDGETFHKIQDDYKTIAKDLKATRGRNAKPENTLLQRFLDLAVTCDNAICCRFSPSQKSFVVLSVKTMLNESADGEIGLFAPTSKNLSIFNKIRQIFTIRKFSGVTLAIGDGANDIPMLESAHVGIGITGREGLAAARASDYSIAQFRFLQPLLFVHGRYCYLRVAQFTLGTFYKSIVFYLAQLFFQIFTRSTGASFFESWTQALYNILFAAFQVLIIGVFEKDINVTTLLQVPELYRSGQVNYRYNIPIFLRWALQGILHSFISVLIPVIAYNALNTDAPLTGTFGGSRPLTFGAGTQRDWYREIFFSDMVGDHLESSLLVLGTITYTTVIFTVTVKVLFIESHNWTIFTFFGVTLSIGFWFAFQVIYSILWPHLGEFGYDSIGMWNYSLSKIQLQLWSLAILCTVLSSIIFDLSFYSFSCMWSKWRHNQTDLKYKPINELLNTEMSTSSTTSKITFETACRAAAAVAKQWTGKWTYSLEWWQEWESVHGIRADLDLVKGGGTGSGKRPAPRRDERVWQEETDMKFVSVALEEEDGGGGEVKVGEGV